MKAKIFVGLIKITITTSLLMMTTFVAQAGIPSGLDSKVLADIRKASKSFTKLSILTKNGELVGIHSTVGDATFWLKDIEKNDGVVLYETWGYKVLLLQGRLSRDSQEGTLKAMYLSDAKNLKYKSCNLKLKNNGSGGWYIQNAYNNKKVNSINVVATSAGVEKLEGLCP
ncbi:MAG: hypothetical protein M9962_03835 [Oligoflexia bacterium]|nr:hypothetical protein [Oligoflexia bacterium]